MINMKRLLLLQFCFITFISGAQYATGVMGFNYINASFSNAGYLFNDFTNNTSGYEIGQGSGLHTLYGTSLVLAGRDINGQLKMAVSSNPNLGTDFKSGPYSSTGNYSDPAYIAQYADAYTTICQEDIDHFYLWWQCQNLSPVPAGCDQVSAPSPEVLQAIYNYPAHGDVSNGVSYFLAPFFDNDANDTYEPFAGDHPIIERGCCMTYMIFNDMNGLHTFSGADPLGVEVHMILYQYNSWNSYLNDATFVDVKIINRGTQTIYDFTTSLAVDPDLGNYGDDMIGCDSTLNLSYVYNGDNFDETNGGNLGFGANPPAFGIVELTDGLSSHVPQPITSNIAEIYNSTLGLQPNGMNYLDNFGAPTKFVYHEDPNIPNGYSQYGLGMVPSDQRFYTNTLTSVFAPGDTVKRSFAFIYEEGSDNLNSVTNLLSTAAQVKQFYDNDAATACEDGVWNVGEIDPERDFVIYPNPNAGTFEVELKDIKGSVEMKIVDMLGKECYSRLLTSGTTQLSPGLMPGVYLILISDGQSRISKQLVVR